MDQASKTQQQNQAQPNAERVAQVPTELCPTCISGTDHTVSADVFQKVLRDDH